MKCTRSTSIPTASCAWLPDASSRNTTHAASRSPNWSAPSMRDYLRTHEGEVRLFVVLAALTLYLGFASPTFFSAGNLASLMNNNAVNVIWAVGLLVVLITGGIYISFAVGASVAQYLAALALHAIGGGNWIFGL